MGDGEKYADKWFSIYIRLRDTDQYGYGKCIETGRRIWYKRNQSTGKMESNCDAGHYVTRAVLSLRYNEANVNAQLSENNRFSNKSFTNMRQNIMRKFGHEIVEWLDMMHKKFGDGDYEAPNYYEIGAYYQKKAESLLKTKMF